MFHFDASYHYNCTSKHSRHRSHAQEKRLYSGVHGIQRQSMSKDLQDGQYHKPGTAMPAKNIDSSYAESSEDKGLIISPDKATSDGTLKIAEVVSLQSKWERLCPELKA